MRGLEIVMSRAAAGGGGNTPVSSAYIETESGTVGAQWTTVADATASGGSYIVRSSGAVIDPVNTTAEYLATLQVTLQAGTYSLYCLMDSPAGNANSSYFRINGGSWTAHNDGSFGTGWHWRTILTGVVIAEGVTTIDISPRESGQKLDKLYITKNGDSPV